MKIAVDVPLVPVYPLTDDVADRVRRMHENAVQQVLIAMDQLIDTFAGRPSPEQHAAIQVAIAKAILARHNDPPS